MFIESAVSQSNRRLRDILERDKELKKMLAKIGKMLNVEEKETERLR